MKAIHTGSMYQIYDDGLETFDKLPPQCYVIRFSQNCGFYMEKYSDITINEEKVYAIMQPPLYKTLFPCQLVAPHLFRLQIGVGGWVEVHFTHCGIAESTACHQLQPT